MWKWFLTNLRTFVLAFMLSVVVWVSAVSQANPDETRSYPRAISIEIVGQDPSLVVTNEVARQVSVSLRAPRSIWEEILGAPSSVRAVLDLSGLGEGTHEVAVQVQVAARPARIIQQNPTKINVTLEPLITRTLDVEVVLSGEPAIGYQIGTPVVSAEQVIVSGPRSLVEQAALAQVILNVSGERVTKTLDVTPRILTADYEPLPALSVSPTSLSVTLPIQQQGGYRDLAVKVLVEGQVASGYRLTNISVFPPVVTVFSADAQLVAGLPGFLETEVISLENAQGALEVRVALRLPEGISVVGEQTVLVQVAITAIESSLTLANTPLDVIGLGAGLRAEFSPETVDVILSGPVPVLDTLRPEDVRVTLDLTGLGEGTHSITPRVEILASGLIVQSLNPATIQVIISANLTPTP
jgi:YbbR domain-containing protein